MYTCVLCGNSYDNDHIVCHTVDGRPGLHCQYCEDEIRDKEDEEARIEANTCEYCGTDCHDALGRASVQCRREHWANQ